MNGENLWVFICERQFYNKIHKIFQDYKIIPARVVSSNRTCQKSIANG